MKKNTSILSFFKKVDSPIRDDSVFLSDGNANNVLSRQRLPSEDIGEDDIYGDIENTDRRFNEAGGSLKRRRISNDSSTNHNVNGAVENGDGSGNEAEMAVETLTPSATRDCTPPPDSVVNTRSKPRRTGPFLDDSDSEDDVDQDASGFRQPTLPLSRNSTSNNMEQTDISLRSGNGNSVSDSRLLSQDINVRVPDGELSSTLSNTSAKDLPVNAELQQQATPEDDIEGFNSQEFPDEDGFGEEYLAKRAMDGEEYEQWAEGGYNDAEDDLQREDPGEIIKFEGQSERQAADIMDSNELVINKGGEGASVVCPICNSSLSEISSDEANAHVNACLDGNPIPLPKPISQLNILSSEAKNSFARKAAVARPGQANPFELGKANTSASAFSRIMASHAEDTAWATAAAAENAARGKPAYQRTCPFYKIMPGFFICVDAFRYGAVQGCNAYFLSHFHSDHYIGLTPSWCHGPIYCSKVTANLVKQQLRVDPKWVVSLEFEEKTEVPGTEGVFVTMIPANHCPGSSLFLFEKVIGKGENPKVQRILHCGDFRACPEHIAHPLLMPDIVHNITGKTTQQKIDVCYLDTTYLNPKYSFPCQEHVIRACADMCVSLQKERVEESDAWEMVKKERAGSKMMDFVNNGVNSEGNVESAESERKKSRGRLLVVCGTYSIGKERMCMGIARALDCKIWAAPGKMRVCAALEDPELMSRMTDDPREAQIHMQGLMEIRPETLQEYLNGFKPHFSRIVGFKPTGWNYRPPNSRYRADLEDYLQTGR